MNQRVIHNPVLAVEVTGNITNGKAYKGVVECYYTTQTNITTLLIELKRLDSEDAMLHACKQMVGYLERHLKVYNWCLYTQGVTVSEKVTKLK